MLYDISLKIEYKYENSADSSRHIVRLLPLDLPGEQRLVAGRLDFTPEPDEQDYFIDFFGNKAVSLLFLKRHELINFSVKARVECPEFQRRLDASPNIVGLRQEIAEYTDLGPLSPHHFLGASVQVPILTETTTFARNLVNRSMSTIDCLEVIGKALHEFMKYDPDATTVDTPMIDAFHARHGVCQDFSHIMIACLRGLGIPAGYVSGYLRTLPPPGLPRLEGADAMHAWVRAWCGRDAQWIEYDPTNAAFAGSDHIIVARGRDYADVAPVIGVMRSWGGHSSKQSVDVLPVAEVIGQ